MKLIATNVRAAAPCNMSIMTTSGNIKAAAERIVIVLAGIMITESLIVEIVVNEMMASVVMLVEIVDHRDGGVRNRGDGDFGPRESRWRKR